MSRANVAKLSALPQCKCTEIVCIKWKNRHFNGYESRLFSSKSATFRNFTFYTGETQLLSQYDGAEMTEIATLSCFMDHNV